MKSKDRHRHAYKSAAKAFDDYSKKKLRRRKEILLHGLRQLKAAALDADVRSKFNKQRKRQLDSDSSDSDDDSARKQHKFRKQGLYEDLTKVGSFK